MLLASLAAIDGIPVCQKCLLSTNSQHWSSAYSYWDPKQMLRMHPFTETLKKSLSKSPRVARMYKERERNIQFVRSALLLMWFERGSQIPESQSQIWDRIIRDRITFYFMLIPNCFFMPIFHAHSEFQSVFILTRDLKTPTSSSPLLLFLLSKSQQNASSVIFYAIMFLSKDIFSLKRYSDGTRDT